MNEGAPADASTNLNQSSSNHQPIIKERQWARGGRPVAGRDYSESRRGGLVADRGETRW